MPLSPVSRNEQVEDISKKDKPKDKAERAYKKGRKLFKNGDKPGAEIELRKSLAYFIDVLAGNDMQILKIQYKLGATLVEQGKYFEGESLLQQAVRGMEDVLGSGHSETLTSKYWLGKSLDLQRKHVVAEKHFREIWQWRKKNLGSTNSSALNSEHWLGQAVYGQGRYEEAEEYFREVWQEWKRALGDNSTSAWRSEFWLGRAICQQARYDEALGHLANVWHGWAKHFGSDALATLDAEYWVAQVKYSQARYSEAEDFFRELLLTIEEKAVDDSTPLYNACKAWLGKSLYEQERFDEVVMILETVLPEQGTIISVDNVMDFGALILLGKTLCRQERYSEAECHLQRALQVFGQLPDSCVNGYILNEMIEYLYMSKYWLGYALEQQGKQSAADFQLQQATDSFEEMKLRLETVYVCRCNYWLGKALCEQKKYHRAEQYLRQAIQGQEHVYKSRSQALLTLCQSIQLMHAEKDEGILRDLQRRVSSVDLLDNKINSKDMMPETPATSPLETTVHSTSVSATSRLDVFFNGNNHSQSSYTDFEISEITSILKHLNPDWSRVPRVYIVLRLISCLHHLDDFIADGFSDYWFPARESRLPRSLSPLQRQKFVDAQAAVLTDSLQLEKGADGLHCYFSESKSLPLEKQRVIGRGGFSQVDQVLSLISYKTYARKRVLRGTLMRGRKPELLKMFVTEIETLKRLQHRHIVEFVGSYSDPKYLGLLIHPVAEMDLSAYFTLSDISTRTSELRTFYGCLATALAFLHENKVRHKDIKPQNILINRGNILLTDFGLALDFAEAQGSTTLSMVSMMTLRYCAPEVVEQEPRGTSSDIWSLGVVFLEMLVILKGKTIEYMDEYFAEHGSGRPYVRTNHPAFSELLLTLAGLGDKGDNRVIGWIRDMLQKAPKSRPKAPFIMTTTNDPASDDPSQTKFGGICCMPHDDDDDDDFSDFSE